MVQTKLWILYTIMCINIFEKPVNSHAAKFILQQTSEVSAELTHCYQPAICEPLHNGSCFGTNVPYSFTSVMLANDSDSQLEAQEKLLLWRGLQKVPRCWAVVQPLLCAIYMPKCENGSLSLPSQEMCRITRGPCRAVEAEYGWPSFLRCENEKLFPPGCRNALQEVKFNTSAHCLSPLVETDNSENWFDGVEGCGVQCQNPFFSEEEHDKVHKFILILASSCLSATLFTVITFLISWKTANRYPAIIIFYINVCFVIASVGWLAQFFPNAREEIVCLHDGTIRHKQPRFGENLSCIIIFILIYYFLMAAIVWFVILTYSWHVLFRQSGVGAPKDSVENKAAYFHLSAWSIPLMLTITIMAVREVDGDSITGICFVGHTSHAARAGFLLVPVTVASIIGGFFLFGGLHTLVKVKLGSQEVANVHVNARIHHMIVRIGTFAFFAFAFVISTFACHVYEFSYKVEWEKSLREYIVCLARISATQHKDSSSLLCPIRSKPNLSMIQLHLAALFGFGIVMSSWVWTRATVESWKRFWQRICQQPADEPVALKRHKVIARAFERRQEINQGHLSFSFNSTHEDPVGMNLELNSVASQEISSTWAAALPQFLTRRGALTGPGPFDLRHYSSASDISQRRISLDSYCGHQQNLDSLSLQISEQEVVAHALRHQRRKTRKERERFLRANRIAPWFPGSRRGSDTSLQSSIIAASVAAAAKNGGKVTKATSTGDLRIDALFYRPPSAFIVSKPLVQKKGLVNPPFTHGMTDNSHCMNASAKQQQTETVPSGTRQVNHPAVGSVNPQGQFIHPLYSPGYDLMQQTPVGYFGGMLFPGQNTGMFPGYLPGATALPGSVDYNGYGAMPYLPYGSYPAAESLMQQYHQPILPLHPTIDSASEAEYLPIIISDSEFTDAGHRSYDEAQLLSAQRLLQEHSQQFAAQCNYITPVSERQQLKPTLQPQSSSQMQRISRMESVGTKVSNLSGKNSRLQSRQKSPHSEAPPPSPAESAKSFAGEIIDHTDLQDSKTPNIIPSCTPDSQVFLPNAAPSRLCSKPCSNENIYQTAMQLQRTSPLSRNSSGREGIEMTEQAAQKLFGRKSRCRSEAGSRNHRASRISYHNSSSADCIKPHEKGSLIIAGVACDQVSR